MRPRQIAAEMIKASSVAMQETWARLAKPDDQPLRGLTYAHVLGHYVREATKRSWDTIKATKEGAEDGSSDGANAPWASEHELSHGVGPTP